MRRKRILIGAVVVCLLCGLGLQAQQSDSSVSDNTNLSASPQPAAGAIPRLIKFIGTVRDLTGEVPTGVVGLTFSLYELPEGGSPLWVETQSLSVDAMGRYTALLGANSPGGMPLDLFTSGKALWVGVQPQLPGQTELPRVLLVAVPYALKSSDADTLGGLPASAYMLATNTNTPAEGSSVTSLISIPLPGPIGTAPPIIPITGGGTANYAAMFTGPATMGNSTIYNSIGGWVGIGTSTPVTKFHVLDTTTAGTIQSSDPSASNVVRVLNISRDNQSNSRVLCCSLGTQIGIQGPGEFGGLNDYATITTVLSGNTASDLFFSVQGAGEVMRLAGTGNVGIGTSSPAAKLEVNGTAKFDGLVGFASGQTFPGAGTLTGVTAGTGLTGGGTTGTVTLSIDNTKVPTLAAGSNVFAGSITASSFSGVGSGLTNVNAATLGGFAASAFQAAGSYATLGANTFTGNQTVSGTVTATTLSSPAFNSGATGTSLAISAANGGGNGGNLSIAAGNAGSGSGGGGGNLTLTAGSAVPLGGSGYTNQGPGGSVNILAGGGYNGYGGSVLIESGSNSNWSLTPNGFTKVSLIGQNLLTSDGAEIDVEGAHNGSSSNAALSYGGNVKITAGNGNGGLSGGNITLTPGTGSPNGAVVVTGNINASGGITAATFSGNGSNLTNVAAASATTASGLSCTGCVGNTQLGINYAASSSQGGAAANSLMFNGMLSSTFAPASGSASYVAKSGDTMTGTLNLPANGLQVGTNQIVTSGGNVGIGGIPAVMNLTEINGTINESSYQANLMMIDGTAQSSIYAQAYLKGLVINPTFNVTNGYANYLVTIEADPGTVVGSNVAHSVVDVSTTQPTTGYDCSVAVGVNVPNQQRSLCYGTYGFYQNGPAQYNYFGSNVGIGVTTPSDALDINNTTGTNILVGQQNGANKFRVDSTGQVFADGNYQTSGADFAESMAVRGKRSEYEPGDLLVIDSTADRHLALSHQAYSTLVAGIYSTKPGVLATPHGMDDPAIKNSEVPLAVVGIVPCKVTAENGPIGRGDLLVASSRPGYAMKGTNRQRMLGAVVGKALEPLGKGTGVIQVLVTLQ